MSRSFFFALLLSLVLHLTAIVVLPGREIENLPPTTTLRIRLAAVQQHEPASVVQSDSTTPVINETASTNNVTINPNFVASKPDNKVKADNKSKPVEKLDSETTPTEKPGQKKEQPKPQKKPKPKPKPKQEERKPDNPAQPQKAEQADHTPTKQGDPPTQQKAEQDHVIAANDAPTTIDQPSEKNTGTAEFLANDRAVEIVSNLPPEGSIRFEISYGEKNFIVGDAHHRWQVNDGRYRIDARTKTNGLVALFRSIKMDASSEGRIVKGLLVPERFDILKNGKKTEEYARFDWEKGQIHFGKENETDSLATGAQDLLSFHYQFVGGAAPKSGTEVYITTGKRYERYVLEVVGQEQLELPAGFFNTLHLRSSGSRTTEMWIALDLLLLPVKIRYTEKNGDIYNEIATNIQISQN